VRGVLGDHAAHRQGQRSLARPPAQLNVRQEAHLVALHRAGEHSTAEIGELLGVGRSTVDRAIERDTRRGEQKPAADSEPDTLR
jgi:DNA-binding MarR family transcriptional regulator